MSPVGQEQKAAVPSTTPNSTDQKREVQSEHPFPSLGMSVTLTPIITGVIHLPDLSKIKSTLSKRTTVMIVRWSLLGAVIIALFWAIYLWLHGVMPQTTLFSFADGIAPNSTLHTSRAWDVLIAPIWALLIILYYSRLSSIKKNMQGSTPAVKALIVAILATAAMQLRMSDLNAVSRLATFYALTTAPIVIIMFAIEKEENSIAFAIKFSLFFSLIIALLVGLFNGVLVFFALTIASAVAHIPLLVVSFALGLNKHSKAFMAWLFVK